MSEPDDTPAQPEADPSPFDGPGWHGDSPARRSSGPERDGVIRVRRRRKGLFAGLPAGRRHRSGRARKHGRRRRVMLLGTGLLGLLILLSIAWLAFTGLKARSDLQAVRAGVATMRAQISAGNLAGAKATARSVQLHADDAHSYTTGPVWALGSAIPYLGDPLDTTRALTSSVQLVADRALVPLVDATDALRPGTLRQPDGTFNLAPITALVPTLDAASGTMQTALRDAQDASGSTWLGAVNRARSQLIDQLAPLRSTVSSFSRAARIVPPLLGSGGPKRYMISFQNDAEIRATGGVPGAFAIVTVDNGRVAFTNFESDLYLVGTVVPGSPFGKAFSDNLFEAAQRDYRDSNYSPNFPYAAQIWASMWKQKTGETLDGAMIIDPTALSYLLKVAGPVTLHDGQQVSAGNVVELTQKTLYDRYPDFDSTQQTERKQYLLDLAQSVSTGLLGANVDTAKLVRAAGEGADQHRLLFWARDPVIEREIADLPLGGTVPPRTKHPYVAVFLNNDSNSKLDYYLRASMDWSRTGCGPTRDVTVTVTLRNTAPATLPDFVEGLRLPRGTDVLDVGMYGSIGGKYTAVSGGLTLPGAKQPFHVSGVDQHHPVYGGISVNLPSNKTKVVVFHLTEPAGVGKVIVRDQPMVHPMTVTVHDQSC